MERESIRLASSSPVNCSRPGSHLSLRPRRMAMSLRWQRVVERCATSAGGTILGKEAEDDDDDD